LRADKISVFILSVLLISISSLALTAVPEDFRDFPKQLSVADDAHECRFWGIVASDMPESVVTDHLVNGSSSLKNLGASNYNGWGLAYYNDNIPVVLRGELPANSDPDFDLAVRELAESSSRIGIGHVRRATSGAIDIPNPHPFVRFKGGKWWAYAHNGGLLRHALKELIGQEYLEQNPPTVGDNWSDPRVVDSDLYMLYILKCIEENGWNVTSGIAKAVKDITQNTVGTMNFILTDGEILWGFRLGNTLYYYYSGMSPQYCAIASQPPTNDKDWVELHDYDLITLRTNNSPTIISNITTHAESLPTADVGSYPILKLGQVVQFNGTNSYDPDGVIVSYEWDFGDGNKANETPTPTHVYHRAGFFVAKLTVRDNDGNIATDWVTLQVVVVQGDINKDGKVDIRDITVAAIALGSYSGHPRWNPQADMNKDGRVDIKDIALIAMNYGKNPD